MLPFLPHSLDSPPPLQALASNPEHHRLSPSLHLSLCSSRPLFLPAAPDNYSFPFSLLISPSTLSPFCYSVSLLLPLPGPGPNSPVARRQAGSEQERQRQLPHVSASLETRDGGMVEEFSGGEKPFRHVCSAKRKRQTPTPHWYTDIQTNNNDKVLSNTHLHHMPSSAWQIQGGKPADSDTSIYGTEIRQIVFTS